MAGPLVIDDDVAPLARQMLGDQRAGDAGADNENIASQTGLQFLPGKPLKPVDPRRAAARRSSCSAVHSSSM